MAYAKKLQVASTSSGQALRFIQDDKSFAFAQDDGVSVLRFGTKAAVVVVCGWDGN
jgi:hypothetical protein